MTNTPNRQPKGTTTGGQFAASANPESTVDLSAPIGRFTVDDEALRHNIAADRATLECVGELENDQEIDLLHGVVDQQDDLIQRLERRVAELSRGQANQPATDWAYAIDEAIDSLTKWDGGSGGDPAYVLEDLKDRRQEILLLAETKDPAVVEEWRASESKVRAYETGADESMSVDEYDELRDVREALFVKIVHLNLKPASDDQRPNASVLADAVWTRGLCNEVIASEAEARGIEAIRLSDEEWNLYQESVQQRLVNGTIISVIEDDCFDVLHNTLERRGGHHQ